MNAKNFSLTRRNLLRGMGTAAGAFTLGLPFLTPLARAAEGGAKRLFIFFSSNEAMRRNYWMPQGGQGDEFTMTGMSEAFAPLQPYMDKLNFIGDLELTSRLDDPKDGGHVGIGHLLIGRRVNSNGPNEQDHWASGISVDQQIGRAHV